MGMIAVMAVMLASITRRLTGTRRLSSGMMTLVVAGVVLLVAVGGASANGACIGATTVFGPGDTVTESCTLNETMHCTGTDGLIIGADDVVIEGYNASQGKYFEIIGDDTALTVGIYNDRESDARTPYDNMVINNVTVSHFNVGIQTGGRVQSNTCTVYVENNTIYNCTVHDISEGYGIQLGYCTCNSTIDNCTVYDVTGTLTGNCEDPGAGIRLYSKSSYNNVTNNTVYHVDLAGIYSKAQCRYNNVIGNTVYENGKDIPGNSYFGGGIRLECQNTDYWTVANNTVSDSWGPGIYVRGKYATVKFNDVSGSKNSSDSRGDNTNTGVGDGFFTCGINQTLFNNIFCDNEGEDIYIASCGTTTSGSDENTCYTSLNYNDDGMTTGCDYACIISCDASGNAKDEFAAGEKVYVKGGGYGFSPGASYNLWVQDDPVSDGDALASDPSGGQEVVTPGGTPPSFSPIEIWDTATNPASLDEWDIVADKQNDGANTGKYNRVSDGIDSSTIGTETMPGFVAPVPEVATFALVGLGLLGLVGYSRLGRRKD